MPLSRRAFLGNISKAAAAHALPSSVLGMPFATLPLPEAAQSVAAVPAFMMIPHTDIQKVVASFGSAWGGFFGQFNSLSETCHHMHFILDKLRLYESDGTVAEMSYPPIGPRVEEGFDKLLPPLFDAVGQFRALSRQVMTGDPQRDTQLKNTLRAVTDLKKEFYIGELRHLVALCPEDYLGFANKSPSGLYGEDYKNHEAKKKYAEMILYLKQSMDRLHWIGLPQFQPEYHELLASSENFGLVDDAYRQASKNRENAAFSSIKPICDQAGIAEETVQNLVGLHADFTDRVRWREDISHLASPLERAEVFEWFDVDDATLFKRIAEIVGKRADDYIRGISPQKDGDPSGYIVTQFERVLQERFTKYFSAALPDVLIENIPLPRIDRLAEGFIKLQTSFLQQGEAASAEAEPVTAESSALEPAAETSAETTPALRLLGSRIMGAAKGENLVAEPLQEASFLDTFRGDNDKASVPKTLPEISIT